MSDIASARKAIERAYSKDKFLEDAKDKELIFSDYLKKAYDALGLSPYLSDPKEKEEDK